MSATNQLKKLQDGTYSKGGAILDWSYYDTFKINDATRSHRLFVNPIGSSDGAGGNKTLADTNMTTAGQIPQGQNFTAKAIKIFYASADTKTAAEIEDFYKMLKDTTLELFISGKDATFQFKLSEVMGSPVLMNVDTATNTANVPLLEQRAVGVYPLNVPITLAALTTFEVRAVHHVAAASTLNLDEITISLNGGLVRSN